MLDILCWPFQSHYLFFLGHLIYAPRKSDLIQASLIMKNVFIITGGIASGKTFLLKEMQKRGILTLSTDKIAKSILHNNIKLSAKIIEKFPLYGDEKGELNMKLMQIDLAHNIYALNFVEGLVHPIVRQECNNFVQKIKKKYELGIAIEVPLFFESMYKECEIKYLYEKIIVTHTNFAIREDRAMLRDGMTKKKFDAIVQLQVSDALRFKYADYIVCCDNKLCVDNFLNGVICH